MMSVNAMQISDGAQLNILAKKINILVEASERQRANYVDLGKLLILARDRVKNETKYTFPDWCARYLVKKDGRPFSYKTIENYIYLASNPERVEKQKEMQRSNIKKIRLKASSVTTIDAINSLFTKNMTTKDQNDILMVIWEQVSEAAQEMFLKNIGARI